MLASLKKHCKQIIYNSNIFLSNKKIILESTPDFSDNAKYVYDELIRRRINENHKLYWFVSTRGFRYKVPNNVYFVYRFSLRAKILHLTSRYILDGNFFVKKMRKDQFRIYLTHGMALKMPYNYAKDSGTFDRCTLTSNYFIRPHMLQYKSDKNEYIVSGSPRNDGFFNNIHAKNIDDKNKYIICMPTFRNHKNELGVKTGISFPYGIPCVSNRKELAALNDCLKKNHVIMVLRPHPAEDLTKLKQVDLSNITLFENSIFAKGNIQLYDSLKDSDALITDYSSVYYDYLLLKKPIGLTIPDLEEYTSVYDLVEKDYKGFMKGFYIESFEDMLSFVEKVAKNKLLFGKDMLWALDRYHKHKDGKSSSRVVDILLAEMERHK